MTCMMYYLKSTTLILDVSILHLNLYYTPFFYIIGYVGKARRTKVEEEVKRDSSDEKHIR